MKKLFFTIFFLFASFLSCYANDSKDKFVSGEIIIGFKESVSGPLALKILKKYGLPIKDIIFSRYTYFFKMPKNETQNYIRHLSNSKLFFVAETQLNASDNPFDIIFAYCRLDTSPEDVDRLVQGFDTLSIQSIETHAISLSVKVNVGQESEWLTNLRKDPNIEYVELNYMAEIAS